MFIQYIAYFLTSFFSFSISRCCCCCCCCGGDGVGGGSCCGCDGDKDLCNSENFCDIENFLGVGNVWGSVGGADVDLCSLLLLLFIEYARMICAASVDFPEFSSPKK